LKLGSNSTIAFLQTLHNDALGMRWIPSPIVPRKMWPKMSKKGKRAITECKVGLHPIAGNQRLRQSVSSVKNKQLVNGG